MLVSKKILAKFIDNIESIDDQQIIQACNAIGLEVEFIYRHPTTSGLLLGKLLSIKKHDQADNLNICLVDVGNKQLQIICGAKNLQENCYVIVAPVGSKLYDGKKIDKKNIRGVESFGMLCSYSELTPYHDFISDDEIDEIVMISSSKKLKLGGDEYKSIIGFDDVIYDLSIPANRNDLQALIVLAFELAGKLNLKYLFKLPEINNKLFKILKENKIYNGFNLLAYDSFKIKTSTWEIKKTLMNNGIKPINNILDQLALITFFTNVPTHVYDKDKINGTLHCDFAKEKSKFIALNNNSYNLTNKDICIYDDNGIVGLAAIMGGQFSKISKDTTSILIEVANFNYLNIRNTALRLNLNSDASKRASKPISTYLIQLTIELIIKYFGLPKKQSNLNFANWNKNKILIEKEQLKNLINVDFDDNEISKIIRKYGFKYFQNKVLVPYWRLDVFNQQDIFEELLKEIDVNNLKKEPIAEVCIPFVDNCENKILFSIKQLMLENYFNEVKTYNLVSKNELESFNLYEYKDSYEINTSNSNRQYLRKNLIDRMLKVYKYNNAYKNQLIPIFELQKIYLENQTINNLTCLITNDFKIDSLKRTLINFDLSYLRSIVDQLSLLLNKKYEYVSDEKSKYFYKNEVLAIYDNKKTIGYIGKIRNNLLKEYDLEQKEIYCLSLNIKENLSNVKSKQFKFNGISNNQISFKDINVTININDKKTINDYLKKFKECNEIDYFKVTSIFEKQDERIYTVRYFLKNDVSYSAQELESINKKLSSLVVRQK